MHKQRIIMTRKEVAKRLRDTGPNGATAKLGLERADKYLLAEGQWESGRTGQSTENNWIILALYKSCIEPGDGDKLVCHGATLFMDDSGNFCSAPGNSHQFDHPTDGRVWYWDAD